jgi:hypothetical protein
MTYMSKLVSDFVTIGFAVGLNTAIAQNADPYKQKETTGASQQQSDQAMKEKLKECRKLSGQAKQDCMSDLQANPSQGNTGAGGTQQEPPQSGQAPSSDQPKRRQQQ